MSASEAERFANDLKSNTGLLDELKKGAAGLGLSGVVEFAKQKGYNIDADDAKSYIETKAHQELTNEQLDRIAGGKSTTQGPGGGSGVGTSGADSSAAQTTIVITSGIAAGEVVTVAIVAGIIVVT